MKPEGPRPKRAAKGGGACNEQRRQMARPPLSRGISCSHAKWRNRNVAAEKDSCAALVNSRRAGAEGRRQADSSPPPPPCPSSSGRNDKVGGAADWPSELPELQRY